MLILYLITRVVHVSSQFVLLLTLHPLLRRNSEKKGIRSTQVIAIFSRPPSGDKQMPLRICNPGALVCSLNSTTISRQGLDTILGPARKTRCGNNTLLVSVPLYPIKLLTRRTVYYPLRHISTQHQSCSTLL